ncbi:polysaccharide biosynthesis C-terminal domain-containing protein [uncultured Oscillibacter sp.]|uniref:polysaccharide biosynthesis C-terminal domain-containing protein n=1 Tax=uncultured Oscillibacter sp. TaxID=876091 RepID=UPI00260EF551|nr:polysaccharide biosynthesis C-terminal domain-containing protein [uncultured Oscillibacter sp.]
MFYGALLLTGANLVLRLAGMSFQVYLSARIGAAGVGLLQLVLSVRMLAFTLGSSGARTCALYLSAEALGRRRSVRPALSGCVCYCLLFALPAAAGFWAFSSRIAGGWIGDGAGEAALRAFALFLPISCLNGVMTGLFTAAGRLRTLVAVEFLEQACSMAVTFALLSRWAGGDPGRACLSVALGSSIAGALSLGALWVLRQEGSPQGREDRPPWRRVFGLSLPVGLADDLRAGLSTVENLIIPRRLALFAGTVNAMADYGVLHGMVFPVLMFPTAILASLADLLVAEFSRCSRRRGQVRVRYLARQGLRVSWLFGVCAGGAVFAAARPLGQLLYHSEAAGACLRLYAPLVPILYLDIVVDAMCKGLGQQSANARYNLLTNLMDVALLWLLLPRFGMGGYYFSFAASHLVNFSLSLRRLGRSANLRFSPGPAVKSALCGAAAALPVFLLRPQEGTAGVLVPMGCYLLALGSLWLLLRVVGWKDVLWLRGLLGARGKRGD